MRIRGWVLTAIVTLLVGACSGGNSKQTVPGPTAPAASEVTETQAE